jgi:predicted MFS family arabinose efflux permease
MDDAPPPAPPIDGTEAAPWRLDTFRALRHRNYRLYFLGQLVSFTGSWVQITALQWLTYRLTTESFWTALILTAGILPAFLLGAWGGALADRVPKRALIFVTQSAQMILALLLAALVLAGLANPWTLLFIALATGIINALDLPARLSFVTDMVGREDLVNAVALNSLMFNAARVAGPWLGSQLLGELGAGMCFLVNGLSFIAVLVGLALMDVRGDVAGPAKGGLRTLLGGFQHLGRRPPIAILVVLTGCISACGWPFLVLLPAYAHRVLGDPTAVLGEPMPQEHGDNYGRLLTGMGGGALLAALVLASFTDRRWRRPFLAFAVFAAAAGLILLSFARQIIPAMMCCALVGFGLVLFNATSQSIVQLSCDDDNRGKVMGVWSIVISGAIPLGNIIFGPLADSQGVAEVLREQGAGCLVSLGVVVVLLFVWTRNMGHGRTRSHG